MYTKTCLAALAFAVLSVATAAPVSSVTARGHRISVGDTTDSVFAVLKPGDQVCQEIVKTPDGLRLTKKYQVNGNNFVLVMARASADGPYVVSRIESDQQTRTTAASAARPRSSVRAH